MEFTRQTTVLFAAVLDSAGLYAAAGDHAAHEAITGCLEELGKATAACGGRVVKTMRDKLMVLVATPDAAADAAVAMHTAMEKLPPLGKTRLALGTGFHYGPVIQQEHDVFGDTVNLAARLVEQTVSGQIITTNETLALLAPLYRAWARRLYPIEIKGRSGEVMLCELVWRADENATAIQRKRPPAAALAAKAMRLRYRDKEIVRRRDRDSVTMGRDDNCGLVIADEQASRRHCTLERRGERFVLADHSSNGTYVTVEGDDELLVQREEITLGRHGWLAFGQPRASAGAEVVEFFCD